MQSTWEVFLDDSDDGQRKKYVLAGALLGRKSAWRSFDLKWKKALNKHPKIAYFHGKELRSLTGEFFQFRGQQAWPDRTGSVAANEKRDILRTVIEESELVAIGIGVLVPDYERVKATHRLGPTHMAKDVFEWVLQNTIIQCTAAIKKVDEHARITFFQTVRIRQSGICKYLPTAR